MARARRYKLHRGEKTIFSNFNLYKFMLFLNMSNTNNVVFKQLLGNILTGYLLPYSGGIYLSNVHKELRRENSPT